MFIFNGYAIMTVRKFVDSRKEMRMENQKEKSTKKDGVITLTTDTDGEWSILKISDTGTGMTRREISNLFKPFYTTKSRITNWGIGLSFAYRIIKYHNGYISVESTLGFGTNFYIYLPAVND